MPRNVLGYTLMVAGAAGLLIGAIPTVGMRAVFGALVFCAGVIVFTWREERVE